MPLTRKNFRGDVHVKTCAEKTKFTTLDEVERELSGEDLMICDSEKAHCIAGVFGGTDSGVTDQTTTVFLESAYFDPVSIRKPLSVTISIQMHPFALS